jgi:four helix bundle protein
MPTIRKLEDLDVWRAAKELTLQVYRLTKAIPARRDYVFCDQIRRAALSITLNIAEGLGRQTDKEFAHFLHIARGSALETQSLLSVGVELGYLDVKAYKKIEDETSHIIAQLSSFSQYLRGVPRTKDGT